MQQYDIQQLISDMTLEEKASLCSGLDFWHTKGIERLGVPSVTVTDGPHGLRKQREGQDNLGLFDSVPATCFPSAAGMACSWDTALLERVGEALGKECQAEDVAVLLGPGTNIKRSPLCGRNFEYFSEDPYLSSQLASSHIKGVQSQGVGTSLKHFAANNQEHRRMSTDARIDERTLREIYLASFETAVKEAEPWTVMCAYNKVNGEYASENETLLTDILREEWGYEGVVVSDWGAVNERVDALKAGLELEMPANNGIGDQKIINAVQEGTLSESTLDTAVERLLTMIFKAVENQKDTTSFDQEKHHQLAREVAQESMVLLKNENDILPLKKQANVAVIGAFAQQPRYQGGGSSHVNPTKLDNIYDELVKTADPQAAFSFAEGYTLKSDDIEPTRIEEAKKVAAQSDVTVVFAGLPDHYESEGYDRTHLHIPENQRVLIEAITEVQSHIVVVLLNGAPVEMPWLDKVQGVLEGYLGGQALGGAIADLLYGVANPSGKLAETFPETLSHNPSYLNFPGEGDTVDYKEGLFVGYRYYDTKDIKPLFPFGYGLSYTTFEYTNISLSTPEMHSTDELTVSVNIKNTGQQAGKEVVQLYVCDKESTVVRPKKELKAFDKVDLQPGEEKRVTLTLNQRSFAYYDEDLKDWVVESGDFDILVGSSSADIHLTEHVYVHGSKPEQTFTITRNTTIGDLLDHPVYASTMKQTLQDINKKSGMFAAMQDEEEASEMMAAMVKYMPLRGLVAFNSQHFDEQMLNALIDKLTGLEG
ncbi:glycoside hydrolase family 3 C-terminal domain-containing protein [Caldalkalibacillus salinus]|uniref:glycoside hydrolase family 3 C-terminal domain-containing protein n=1 Tax=Caldalkalibacillus salinus TaxID=2803787 RepID=UPI001924FA5A|nr:glycoside hydrolase family 3 C-terminal domain-containing protein [Caldalkalibacillus salinus]